MSSSKVKPLLLACCLVVLPLLTLVPTPAQGETSGLNLNYTVTIQKGQPWAHIRLEITGISSSFLTLRFKPEAYYVEGYVHNLSASSGGSPLTVTYEGQGKWRVESIESSLTLEYDIDKLIPFGYWTPEQGTTSVYIDDEGGVIMAPYFFIYPEVTDVNSVQIKFNVPTEWVVVTPYPIEGDHFEVQKITRSLLIDFLHRQQIYMGKMKFYTELEIDNCTVKLGVLEADKGCDAMLIYRTQADIENALNVTAKCLENLVDLFGENPYKVFTMYTRFSPSEGGPCFPDERYMGNGYAYWPEHRWDELLGHMIYAFMVADFDIGKSAPLLVKEEIMKGIGEMYYGPKLAWRLFNDPIYLGKMYYWYLIYERFSQSNETGWWEFPVYLKGPFVGLMLDNETQETMGGAKSLNDVVKYLYSAYKNTGHTVDYHDLQVAVETVTGKDFQELFSRYIYGNETIPYQYIQNYKSYFLDYPNRFAEAYCSGEDLFYGYTIPLFINIELIVHRKEHVPMGALIFASGNVKNFANYVLSHYTIDNLTEKNVEDALSALAGADCSGFFTRWEKSYGRLSLGELKDWLRDYNERQEGGPTTAIVRFEANGLGADASGTVLTVDGVGYSHDQLPLNFTWEVGSTHIVGYAEYIESTVDGKRYACHNPPRLNITVTEPGVVTAAYHAEFRIDVSGQAGKGTTDPAPGSYWVDDESTFTVKAVPEAGYVFSEWKGTVTSKDNPLTIKVHMPYALQATFIEAFDFSVSVIPATATAKRGTTLTFSVNVELAKGLPQTVQLSVSAPSNTNAYFSMPSGQPPFTATLTIATSPNTPTGSYQVRVEAASGNITRTAYISLTVTDSEQPWSWSSEQILMAAFVFAVVVGVIGIFIRLRKR